MRSTTRADLLRWALLGAVALTYSCTINTLSRWFIWDEAVYFSQSGPLPGAVTGPAYYSPSRELGTPAIVWFIRLFVPDSVTWVRFGWGVIVVALAAVTFREIGRLGPRWSGEIGFFLFLTFWITTGYATAYFGSLIGGLAALLTAALYIRVQRGDGRPILTGVLLGMALSAMWFMRTVESAVVVVVLVAHAALWHRGEMLRRRWRALAAAVASYVVFFVVPWTIHSQVVYGSPWGHLTAWLQRRQKREAKFQAHLHDGIPAWFRLLSGDSYIKHRPAPVWPQVVVGAALVALTIALVIGLVHWFREGRTTTDVRRPPLGLLTALGFASWGLFFFYVVPLNDRYALIGWAFTAAVAGLLAGRLLISRRARLAAVAIVVAGATWFGANAALSHFYDGVRINWTVADEQEIHVIRAAHAKGHCVLLYAGASRPSLDVGSVCKTRVASVREFRKKLPQFATSDQVVFALWRHKNGRPPFDRSQWKVVAKSHRFMLWRALG